MTNSKPVSKISFTREETTKSTEVSIETTSGRTKNFQLDDGDMIQLQDTLNLYNSNFIKNDHSSTYSQTETA